MNFLRSVTRAAAVSAILAAAALTPCRGATLLVEGFLEGDIETLEFEGDTMDYYNFEVLTEGTVRIEVVPGFGGGLILLASFIGRDDEFGFIGNPYRIEPPGSEGRPQFLERPLDVGEYVVAMGGGGRSSYDIFDGYVAVNPEGGGFPQAPYAYTITGDVRGLEYWDGHLDGTFTVTQIPEASAVALLGLAAGGLLWKRRKP